MKPDQTSPAKVVLRLHAEHRMFARSIKTTDVEAVLSGGETIENYPSDTPYPSRLVLGWVRGRPLHVVAAENQKDGETIVITALNPTPLNGTRGSRGGNYECAEKSLACPAGESPA